MDLGSNLTSVIISIVTAISTIATVVIQTRKNNVAIEKTSAAIEQTAKETKAMMDVNDYKTYLLLLLANYPTKADEIFYTARHYFVDLGGDSFVVPLFEDWLHDRELDKPEWFLAAQKAHKY